MKCVEVNPPGNFDTWQPSKLFELQRNGIPDFTGENLLFENEDLKTWELSLEPQERVPFQVFSKNYFAIAMTDGLTIIRSSNGRMSLATIHKGDTMFFEFEGKEGIHDLENIGEHTLLIHLMEFKTLVTNAPKVYIESRK